MNTLFAHPFIEIIFDEKTGILSNTWTSKTLDMQDSEYRELAEKQTAYIEQLNPHLWLVNLSELQFTLAPITQEWADTNLFPRILAAGVEYIAFVISPNLFAQISVEQLMDEKNVKTSNFEIKYFDKETEARNWLASF